MISLAAGCSSEPAPTPEPDSSFDAAEDAQPEDADAQPEDADAQPEDADAQPEDADAQPGDADAQPEDADAQPEDADAQPEDADADATDATDADASDSDAGATDADLDATDADGDTDSADASDSDADTDADPILTVPTCTADVDCTEGHCSNGVCTPEGHVYLPPATYTRGAPTTERGFHEDRENGEHTAVLTRGFYMKTTTVTQGEWLDVMGGSNPAYFAACGGDCPIEHITWWEALAYANALSASEGLEACYNLQGCVGRAIGTGCYPTDRDEGQICSGYYCDKDLLAPLDLDCNGYRLPTEAEWEYAARGGTTTAFITPSGDLTEWGPSPVDPEMDQIAWYIGNSAVTYPTGYDCSTDPDNPIPCGTHPVAQKAPNGFGLYDMTGNVWELVWDWAGDYPEPGTTVTDPTGPATGIGRRMRGGTYVSGGQYLRVAYRTKIGEASRLPFIGFRLVRTVTPAQD
ncbi:formylglycine-generating enzyme family protein [Lujinxingia vulgaris]|uniref:formylglycine-generating enzyme family protein n=1 Tax=Lujinxingia vulgaris TaxID=2600176 RepID=UPI001E6416F1|nr:formylglycine-generating enzyme family protein [Lujinxingia vulgaris]